MRETALDWSGLDCWVFDMAVRADMTDMTDMADMAEMAVRADIADMTVPR